MQGGHNNPGNSIPTFSIKRPRALQRRTKTASHVC